MAILPNLTSRFRGARPGAKGTTIAVSIRSGMRGSWFWLNRLNYFAGVRPSVNSM